jgi:hypothetical protein
MKREENQFTESGTVHCIVDYSVTKRHHRHERFNRSKCGSVSLFAPHFVEHENEKRDAEKDEDENENHKTKQNE